MGMFSFKSLGRSEDPSFAVKQMVISAAWPGASAKDVEMHLTNTLEKQIQSLPQVKKITSYSRPGVCVITVALKDEVSGNTVRLYIARRLIRFASEDVGIADSNALPLTVACYQACHFIGMPECNVNLTQAVVYLSMAPKSNALYLAYGKAREDAQKMLSEPVPLQIRNAVTDLMADLHYGEGYVYAHDTKEKVTAMQCLPDSIANHTYYHPTNQGKEAAVKKRLEEIKEFRNKHS